MARLVYFSVCCRGVDFIFERPLPPSMGNQTSLEGRRDRLGAIVYSELRRKFDADGSTVDNDDPSPLRAAVVSHWLGTSRPTRPDRERPAPVAAALSPEAGSNPGARCAVLPNDGDGNASDGGDTSFGVPNASAIAALRSASDALQPPPPPLCRTVTDVDAPVRPGDQLLDGGQAAAVPKRSGRRGDGRRLAICASSSGAIAAESYRSGSVVDDLDDPSRWQRERRSGASSSEEDVPGAADDTFYDGDRASGQTTPPLPGPGDCYSHPLADLLPSAALPRSPNASLAVGEDLFSRLQSELDAVYAEARDIELCLGQLSLKRPPPTGSDALRPLRSVSVAETRSDGPSPSSDACRAGSAAVRRHTTISTHHLRLSAPEALTSWQASNGNPLSTTRPKAAAKALDGNPAGGRPTVGDCIQNGDDHGGKLDVPNGGDGELYVSEACPLMVHAMHRLGNLGHADTLKGYKHIAEDLGLRSMYAVRSDLYCAVRACLAGALLQGIAVYDHLQPAEKLLKALHECIENHHVLQNWESTESEQQANGIVARLEPYLVILYDLCYQALVCPAAVREYVIHRLVNDIARDRACMEAVKVLMVLRAYELHQVMTAEGPGVCGSHVPAYAHLLFASDAYRDPDCLFGTHVSGVGIRHRLAQDVMPLLADVLGIGLLVLWPSRFGRADFAFEFNASCVELSGPRRDRLVSLVADDDGFYGVVVP